LIGPGLDAYWAAAVLPASTVVTVGEPSTAHAELSTAHTPLALPAAISCAKGSSTMKRSSLLGGLTLAASFLVHATTAVAHHSFAMFDRSRTEMITGTVKEFELINPHGWLRIMVPDAHGVQNEWSLELGGAGQLARVGWTSSVVHPGDKVVVRMHPLRDGSYGGQLISVTLPNGQVLPERRGF
jgi:Family of unknown function (DUF6152)